MPLNGTDFSSITDDIVGGLTTEKEKTFLKMVRSTNVIVNGASNIDIRDVAEYQAIPRIGLILSAAKNLNNQPLFGGSTAQEKADNVALEMTDGVYSSGIRRVASALTASILTRNIPLASSIDQIKAGDMLEKQALEDLDRIINLYEGKAPIIEVDNGSAGLVDSVYLSLGIDPTTLKALDPNTNITKSGIDVFDIMDPTKTLEENNLDEDGSSKFAISPEGTRSYKRVPFLGTGKFAYCYYFLSRVDDGVTPGPKSIEAAFPIPSDSSPTATDGWTGEQIIEKLSDSINSATLTDSVSNILVSPNRGSLVISTVSVRKSNVFPDTESYSTPYLNQYRRALPILGYKLHSLTFDVRKYSNIVQNELITVIFYTADFGGLTAQQIRATGKIGVKGIVYGTSASYSLLEEEGPHSLLIQLAKGKTATTGTGGGGGTTVTPQYEKEKDLLYPDTVFFRFFDAANINTNLQLYQKPITQVTAPGKPDIIPSVTGTLKWRVSTTPALEGDLPVEYSINAADILTGSTDVLAPEKIARAFLDSMYSFTKQSTIDKELKNPDALLGLNSSTQVTSTNTEMGISTSSSLVTSPNQGNNVLGALVHSNAVQIIAFRSIDFNSKAIVDILEVPTNIEVATGTPLFYKSTYQLGPRSIVVETIPLRTKLGAGSGTGGGGSDLQSDKELLDENPSTAQTVRGVKSVRLQSVYDRLDFLKNNTAKPSFGNNKWH